MWLGSWLSVALAALPVGLMALRLRLEERFLIHALPAYGAYIARVPYRLVYATSSISSSVSFAISAACNNLLGYPHGQERAWPQWISVPPEELSAAYARLRASVRSG